MLGLMLIRTHRRLLVEVEAEHNVRLSNLIRSQDRQRLESEASLRKFYEDKLRKNKRGGKRPM